MYATNGAHPVDGGPTNRPASHEEAQLVQGRASASSTAPPPGEKGGRFRKDHLSFDVPQGWTDSTLLIFVAPGPAPATNVTIVREQVRPGETLRVHADRKLLRLIREVPGFDIVESAPMQVGGRAAIRLRFTWLKGNHRHEETVVMVDPAADPEGRVTAFSATAPVEAAETARSALATLLATVRFDEVMSSASECVANEHLASTPPPIPRGQQLDAIPMIPMPGVRSR